MSNGNSTGNGENSSGTPTDSELTMEGAAELLTKRWKDGGDTDPSKTDAKGAKPDADEEETDAAEGDEDTETEETDKDTEDHDEGDAEDDKEKDAAKTLAGDDAEVEIQVDGKAARVSVKDLKRLYGQEASLTRKSQEVAEARKAAEAHNEKLAATLTKLQEKAQAKLKPYQEIDFLVASKMMDAEEFAKLRQEAKAAYDEVQNLDAEVKEFMEKTRSAHAKQFRENATKANEILATKITDWNAETYKKITDYAVKQGLPQEVVQTIVDPSAIVMLNKARLYDELKAKASTMKKTVVAKTVKNPVKADKAAGTSSEHAVRKAVEKASKTGRIDDAAAALMARWG